MKRLICMLALFAIMISASIIEIKYVSSFYNNQNELLVSVESLMNDDPENIDSFDVMEAMDKAYSHWTKGKSYVLMLGNHNTVKFVDEKLVSLKEFIRMNQEYDAFVSLKTAQCYIKDLANEVLPKIGNLL